MRRAAQWTSLVCAASALIAAAPAFADGPPPSPAPPPPAPVPAPAPAPTPAPPAKSHASIDVLGGLRLHGRAYVLNGDRVTLIGHVKPYVPGQTMRVRIASPHRRASEVRAKVAKGKGEGVFKVVFRVRRAVHYIVAAHHVGNDKQLVFTVKAGLEAINAGGAGPGSHGVGVALLKQGLRALGYPAGSGPSWTDKLGRELMAFRKVNEMERVFTANRAVFSKVFAGRGAFQLRHPDAGRHVEFDWSRQVLALADGPKVVATYHASSGKPSTPTVFGTFHFYLKGPGTNAKGMFMSNYFIRGYAVHGYPDVPAYAASHGCIRVPNADALAIYGWIKVGYPIFVYR